jgi:zinc transporter ZupT
MALSLGLSIGVVQWQMLKPHVAQAQLWVPICIAAFFIGFAVGLPLSGEGREWLSLGVVALLTAVFTGAGMVWLARRETAVAMQ